MVYCVGETKTCEVDGWDLWRPISSVQCDRISSLLPWSASDCHHRLYHRFPEHYFCLISQSGYQQLCRITIRSNLFQSKSPFVSNIADLLITTERASIMFSMTSSEVFISICSEDEVVQRSDATGCGLRGFPMRMYVHKSFVSLPSPSSCTVQLCGTLVSSIL